MGAGEYSHSAPQQQTGVAHEQGAGPDATCLILALPLTAQRWSGASQRATSKLPLQLVHAGR